jgi:acyl-CoA synthetase (AMP-forming)/AMP-acid ligase II
MAVSLAPSAPGEAPLVLERATPLTLERNAVAEPRAFRAMIRAGASDPAHRASKLVDGQLECAYPEIVARIGAIQRLLLDHGLQPGDCVVAELSGSLCSALTILSLLDGGYSVMVTRHPAVGAAANAPAPPPARFSKAFVSVRPNASPQARVLSIPETFVEIRANPAYSPAAPAPHKDHPRIYTRTSGSLGAAKIVVRSFECFRLNVLNMASRLRFDPSMRMALPTPICHLFGLGAGLLVGVHSGVSIDLQERPNALRFFEREEAFNPDIAIVVPTFCETLLRVRRAPRPYRFLVSGGDAMSDATRRRTEQLHGPLINAYGSSEMGFIAMPDIDAPPEVRATAACRLMPGVSMRLLLHPQSSSDALPIGELQLKTAFQFEKYVDTDGNPVEVPQAFDGDWFRTGDLARLGPNEMLQILGRCDLSVNRNGLLLPFADVEARLREVEGVEQAVVVAGAQGIRGRALVAFCVLARNVALTPGDVRERYAARAPAYSVPDSVRIIPALPQLPSGKIDRRALAEAAACEP